MADRTLVAYEREHGFDTHYAHDGVDLDHLTAGTPTSDDSTGDDSTGDDSTSDRTRLRELLAERGIRLGPSREGPGVDPEPLGTGLCWAEVVAGLDYQAYDYCLRVAADGSVTSFLALWFGFEARGGDPRDPVGDGALLAVDASDEPFVRGWFEGLKSATADGLRCGLYDEPTARSYLGGRVRAFADREVYVAEA